MRDNPQFSQHIRRTWLYVKHREHCFHTRSLRATSAVPVTRRFFRTICFECVFFVITRFTPGTSRALHPLRLNPRCASFTPTSQSCGPGTSPTVNARSSYSMKDKPMFGIGNINDIVVRVFCCTHFLSRTELYIQLPRCFRVPYSSSRKSNTTLIYSSDDSSALCVPAQLAEYLRAFS